LSVSMATPLAQIFDPDKGSDRCRWAVWNWLAWPCLSQYRLPRMVPDMVLAHLS